VVAFPGGGDAAPASGFKFSRLNTADEAAAAACDAASSGNGADVLPPTVERLLADAKRHAATEREAAIAAKAEEMAALAEERLAAGVSPSHGAPGARAARLCADVHRPGFGGGRAKGAAAAERRRRGAAVWAGSVAAAGDRGTEGRSDHTVDQPRRRSVNVRSLSRSVPLVESAASTLDRSPLVVAYACHTACLRLPHRVPR
jgi:hypothetical protein